MKQIFTALLFLFVVGCYKTEYSPTLTEPATVSDSIYTPAQHGSAVGPVLNTSGNAGLAITSVDVPEAYAVVFKCQHGKFIVKRKDIWEKLQTGDKVVIQYREEYHVTDKERVLHKFDFIDANKVD